MMRTAAHATPVCVFCTLRRNMPFTGSSASGHDAAKICLKFSSQSLPIRPRCWTHHMLGECSASLVLGLAAAAIEPVVAFSRAEPFAGIPPGAVLKQLTGSVAAISSVNLQKTTLLLVRHWFVGLAAAALRLQDSTTSGYCLFARGICMDGLHAIHEI